MDDYWLSEWEMTLNEEPYTNQVQSEEMNNNNNNNNIIGEDLAILLGQDFSFVDSQIPTNFLHQSSPNYDDQQYSPNSILPIIQPHTFIAPTGTIINDNDKDNDILDDPNKNENVSSIENASNGEEGTKLEKRKRRDPEKVQGHIMAERKRREVLGQQFIALSALVPGLKKVDKTSILGETIKHLKEMKERVISLEEEASSSRQDKGSTTTILVQRTQLFFDNNKNNDDNNNNKSVYTEESVGTIPSIEVKVSRKNVLLRIFCVRRNGILSKICKHVERSNMTVLHTNSIVFDSSTLDITIVAKMEAATAENDMQVMDLVRTLYTILRNS